MKFPGLLLLVATQSQTPIVEREAFNEIRTCWSGPCSAEQERQISGIWAHCAHAEQIDLLVTTEQQAVDDALKPLGLKRASVRLLELRKKSPSLPLGLQTLDKTVVFVRDGSIAPPLVVVDELESAHELRVRRKPTVVAACSGGPEASDQQNAFQSVWAVEAATHGVAVSLAKEFREFFPIPPPKTAREL
jgi:hypothetical protein